MFGQPSLIGLVDGTLKGQCQCHRLISQYGAIDCCRTFDLNGDRWNDLLISCEMGGSNFYGELLYTGTNFCIRQNSTQENLADICEGLEVCDKKQYN